MSSGTGIALMSFTEPMGDVRDAGVMHGGGCGRHACTARPMAQRMEATVKIVESCTCGAHIKVIYMPKDGGAMQEQAAEALNTWRELHRDCVKRAREVKDA